MGGLGVRFVGSFLEAGLTAVGFGRGATFRSLSLNCKHDGSEACAMPIATPHIAAAVYWEGSRMWEPQLLQCPVTLAIPSDNYGCSGSFAGKEDLRSTCPVLASCKDTPWLSSVVPSV